MNCQSIAVKKERTCQRRYKKVAHCCSVITRAYVSAPALEHIAHFHSMVFQRKRNGIFIAPTNIYAKKRHFRRRIKTTTHFFILFSVSLVSFSLSPRPSVIFVTNKVGRRKKEMVKKFVCVLRFPSLRERTNIWNRDI